MYPQLTIKPDNAITNNDINPPPGTAERSTSLGFNRTDFASLCKEIEVSIGLIQNSCEHLDKQLQFIGTSKDLAEFRNRIYVIFKKTNNRIRSTGEDLESLQTNFTSNVNSQQEINMEKIKQNYFIVIKNYFSVQKRIVLNAQQSDKRFWDTIGEEDEREVKALVRVSSSVLVEEQEKRGNVLLKRQNILRQMELEILDINEIIINLVSGLVNDHSWQLDSMDRNIGGSTIHFEEDTKDANSMGACQTYCRSWWIFVWIALILVLILLVASIFLYIE